MWRNVPFLFRGKISKIQGISPNFGEFLPKFYGIILCLVPKINAFEREGLDMLVN